MSQAVAVLDVGKTNVKLTLFDQGRLLWERSAPNRFLPGPPYPHEDVDSAWAFLLAALSEAARAHKIGALVPTAHGAAGALIGPSELAAPVMDYEFPDVEQIEPDYAKIRPPFSESLSPKVPAGLNLVGRLRTRNGAVRIYSPRRNISSPIRNIGPGGSPASQPPR